MFLIGQVVQLSHTTFAASAVRYKLAGGLRENLKVRLRVLKQRQVVGLRRCRVIKHGQAGDLSGLVGQSVLEYGLRMGRERASVWLGFK